MAVFAPSDNEFGDVAREIASDRDEDVVTDLEATTHIDGPVFYVDSPGNLDEAKLLALQQRLREKGPEDGAFSVITGYTADAARNLYYREEEHGDEHGLLCWYKPDEFTTDEATMLEGDSLTADDLSDLVASGLQSLSVEAHGWTIHMHLQDGYVCGVPEGRSVETFQGTQPSCIRGDELHCPYDEQLLPADRIDASHVFVRTCTSMLNNNFADLPVHVGMGLLDGATSLIGPYRSVFGYDHEPLLHYSLLRAGYTTAERCYLLNRDAEANDADTFPFAVFGQPYATASGSSTGDYEATTDGTSLTVEDVDAHVVDVKLDASELATPTDRYYVRAEGDVPTENDLRYLAFEEGDGVRVVLYTGTRMDVAELRLKVSATPASHEKRRIAFASHRNAQRQRNFDVLPSKAVKQLDDLWHRTRDLPEDTADERFFVEAGRDAADRVDEQFGYIEGIRDQLLSILNDGKRFHEKYAHRATDDDAYPADEDCAYCGRQVFVKQVSDGDETRRALGTCPRCGKIFDVPVEGRNRSPPYPRIRKQYAESGECESIVVTFENPTDDPMNATVYPTVLDFGSVTDAGERIFTPAMSEQRVPPGATTDVEFDVRESVLDPDQHYVVAFVIGNLEVYAGTTPYIVGDRPGRRHRRYQ